MPNEIPAAVVTSMPPSRPRSPETLYVTSDAGAAERVLSSAYGTLRMDARGQGGGMRLAQTSLSSSIRLDHASFSMCFDVRAAPQGALPIGHLRSGRIRNVPDGSERSYRPGDVFLAAKAGHSCTARVENADVEVAVLDPALVCQVAGTVPNQSRKPVQFTGYEPVSRQAAALWKSTYVYVRQLAHDPEAVSEPLVTGSASRLLAAAALAAFPNNAQHDPTAADRHDAHPATLRRAVSFIEDNAYRDISAADIAAACSVTVRAVQLAFRRHLDTTPMEYLRRVRLEHAHQELVQATPDDKLTVTAVSYRWGFPSPSRFSSFHRRAYGVTPSQVLRHG